MGIQLTSFDPETWLHQQWDPTDLLWSKKHDVTNRGIQLTSFDPKTWRHQQGDPTDLLWSKKRDATNKGIQLTYFDPKNVTSPTGGSIWPPLIQKTLRHRVCKLDLTLRTLSSLSIFQELLWSDWCDGIVVALVYCQRRILQNLRLTCSIRCSCMSRPVRFCETGWAGKFLLTCCQTSPLS